MKKGTGKGTKALRRMKVRPMPEINRSEMDKNIFDVVMQLLYINADKNEIDLDKDILAHMSIKLPRRESVRVWNVLTSSAWLSPVVGFGQAGKIALTNAGFQLMSQYGSYRDYLATMQENQPQAMANTVPLNENEATKALPATEPPKGQDGDKKTS